MIMIQLAHLVLIYGFCVLLSCFANDIIQGNTGFQSLMPAVAADN